MFGIASDPLERTRVPGLIESPGSAMVTSDCVEKGSDEVRQGDSMSDTDQDERDQEQSGSGLKVTDRRLFAPDGTPREGFQDTDEEEKEGAAGAASAMADEPGPALPAEQEGSPQEGSAAEFEHRAVEEPKGVDFTMLISAMAQPALLFLGEINAPGSDEPHVDIEQARIQIDMLELLRVKCRGNLSPEEEALLDRILYQLRMLYVARSGGGGS